MSILPVTHNDSGRVILQPPRDGAFNMAADEVLAEKAAREGHVILRLFQWNPWTLSLGKHQLVDGVDLERCRRDRITVVRRLTGGRAVLHARELTYSVCVPVRSEGVGIHHDLAMRVAQALCHGLRALGAEVDWVPKRRGNSDQHSVPEGVPTLRKSALCFASVARGEILWHGKKVVGSAQRVLDGVILQHGSILLDSGHEQIVNLFSDKGRLVQDSSEILTLRTATLKEILGDIPDVSVIARSILEGFRERFSTLNLEEKLTHDEEVEIRKRALPYFLGGWERASTAVPTLYGRQSSSDSAERAA